MADALQVWIMLSGTELLEGFTECHNALDVMSISILGSRMDRAALNYQPICSFMMLQDIRPHAIGSGIWIST
jgi:hypothetical protein